MNLKNRKLVEETERYKFELTEDGNVLVFSWKDSTELGVEGYMAAVRKIAGHSKTYRPTKVLIDKREFKVDVQFDRAWWTREILPIYHEAGISGFGHITGDPNASGEYAEVPRGVKFKMGYFTDLDAALQWKLE